MRINTPKLIAYARSIRLPVSYPNHAQQHQEIVFDCFGGSKIPFALRAVSNKMGVHAKFLPLKGDFRIFGRWCRGRTGIKSQERACNRHPLFLAFISPQGPLAWLFLEV